MSARQRGINPKRQPAELEPDPNVVAHWRNKFLAEVTRAERAETEMRKARTALEAAEGRASYHDEEMLVLQQTLDESRAEVRRLQGEVQIAERTVAHYRQENVSLSAAYISVSESMRPLQKLNEDLQAIALFLRYNYADEIAAGRHSNRSLSDVVTGYLARERQGAEGGWWKRLFGGRRKPSGGTT